MSDYSGPHRAEDEIVGQDAAAPSGALKGGRSERTAAPVPAPKRPPMPVVMAEESWAETFKTIAYALLIALFIRTFFFQPFVIPSASMEDTLRIGDYLFVEKFAYGYSRNSFPWGLGPLGNGWHGRVWSGAAQRGDVVVFKMPNANSVDYGKDFIKRVIGLPGDRIQMIHDRLYINDKIVPQTRVEDYVETIDGYQNRVPRYREILPGGYSHYILDRTPDGPYDNTDVFVVPPGHYFMMGDNRDNSDDSRAEVGYVPAENLVGKAEIIFFSLDEKTSWWEIWYWPWAIRWGRLLHFVV